MTEKKNEKNIIDHIADSPINVTLIVLTLCLIALFLTYKGELTLEAVSKIVVMSAVPSGFTALWFQRQHKKIQGKSGETPKIEPPKTKPADKPKE